MVADNLNVDEIQKENEVLKSKLDEVLSKLQDRVDELGDLEEAGILVNSSFNLDRILVHLMEITLKFTLADVGSIMLKQGDTLETRITWGLDERVVQSIKVKSTDRAICDEALLTGKIQVFSNPAQHPDILMENIDVMIESIISVPLLSKDKTVGVINVINSMRMEDLDDFSTRMLSSVAGFAAVAIDNSVLHKEALEKQKYEDELQLGRNIQLRLLPAAPPDIEGFELAAKYSATKGIGGDYYDMLSIGDNLHIVIADVSNKGIPAALVMTATRAILRGNLTQLSEPKEVLARSNNLIYADINQDTDMFVTMFYGCIDVKTKTMIYTNAGHCYPVICRPGHDDMITLKEGGIFLGIMEDVDYDQGKIQLQEGDLLFFYTDGVSESMNANSELYGDKRIYEFVKNNYSLSAKELVDKLFAELIAYSGNMPQFDDIAMMAIKIH